MLDSVRVAEGVVIAPVCELHGTSTELHLHGAGDSTGREARQVQLAVAFEDVLT